MMCAVFLLCHASSPFFLPRDSRPRRRQLLLLPFMPAMFYAFFCFILTLPRACHAFRLPGLSSLLCSHFLPPRLAARGPPPRGGKFAAEAATPPEPPMLSPFMRQPGAFLPRLARLMRFSAAAAGFRFSPPF